MRTFFLFTALGFFTCVVNAQEITIKLYEENGYKGYLVNLTDAEQKAESFIGTYFKQSGKVRYRDGYYNISGLARADFPYPEITLYSNAEMSNGMTKAYIMMADTLMDEASYSAKLKELMYTFSIEFYRSLVQEEIDESLQALKFTERQYQKLDRDSLNLQSDLVDNRDEKKKLEEALKTNEFNYNVLLQKIIDNKEAKDSLIISIDKIKRLIEAQEEKKRSIQ